MKLKPELKQKFKQIFYFLLAIIAFLPLLSLAVRPEIGFYFCMLTPVSLIIVYLAFTGH